MEQELTYAGFIDFINEQREDREIDQGGGWGGCALGDYAWSACGERRAGSEFSYELSRANPDLYDFLGSGPEEIDTYGALQAHLAAT